MIGTGKARHNNQPLCPPLAHISVQHRYIKYHAMSIKVSGVSILLQ